MKNIILSIMLIGSSVAMAQEFDGVYTFTGNTQIPDFPLTGFDMEYDQEASVEMGDGWSVYSALFRHHQDNEGVYDVYSIGAVIMDDEVMVFRVWEIIGDPDKKIDVINTHEFYFDLNGSKLVLTDENDKEYSFDLINISNE